MIIYGMLGIGAGAVVWRWARRRKPTPPPEPLFRRQQRVVLTENLRPGQTGSISFRGRVWSARNVSHRELKAGESARLERIGPQDTLVLTAHGGLVELPT